MKYAKIENGEMLRGPCFLPRTYHAADGTTITGFNCLGNAALRAHGWLPVEYADLGEDQRRGAPIIEAGRVFYPAEDISEAEILQRRIHEASGAVTTLIQSQVDAYNQAHGLAFDSVHNCESYSRVDGYTHQQFCIDVWNWNVAAWEAARAILADVEAGERDMPTVAEFLADLPVYEGVM